MWGIIATWRMALEGVTESASALAAGKPVSAAVVDAVAAVGRLSVL
ncbi:peptidase T2, asparaginase 2 [Enterobacter asburiae]|uniref:Peptidase T2, asparaginase 2 n=1 Tax=Enterobacter asburiae TaxID=61645 RepID=A0A376FK63_ENTAS|nr:peptidase T2, asparaginase 2 [Enterobacter asburiae]